jgi:hypothetical protein
MGTGGFSRVQLRIVQWLLLTHALLVYYFFSTAYYARECVDHTRLQFSTLAVAAGLATQNTSCLHSGLEPVAPAVCMLDCRCYLFNCLESCRVLQSLAESCRNLLSHQVKVGEGGVYRLDAIAAPAH